ncbi:toxin glutamine deamidase domain-containing protein [Streptomyces sp. NPDC008061]|uniref:toxin glutamine deamidase domain-containing protein n=1 Tax=Streptomyces sp. NPDC008061 TaxID=3364805 RepID=UPI0036E94761
METHIRTCFDSPIPPTTNSTGKRQPTYREIFAHIREAVIIYEGAAANPPNGMTPEQAVEVLRSFPSYKVTEAAKIPGKLHELITTQPRRREVFARAGHAASHLSSNTLAAGQAERRIARNADVRPRIEDSGEGVDNRQSELEGQVSRTASHLQEPTVAQEPVGPATAQDAVEGTSHSQPENSTVLRPMTSFEAVPPRGAVHATQTITPKLMDLQAGTFLDAPRPRTDSETALEKKPHPAQQREQLLGRRLEDSQRTLPGRLPGLHAQPPQAPAPGRITGHEEEAEDEGFRGGPVVGSKRARDESTSTGGTDERQRSGAKRARTRSYENTDVVLRDRGLVPPTPAQREALESYLRAAGVGAGIRLTPELLRLVNPHRASADGGELQVCLEATEALRDTFLGRPRPAGQPEASIAELTPGWTLFKRHGAPVVYGPSELGVDQLLARVGAAGPGTFSTVLFGREGEYGHALALVHTAEGIVWADATTHRVWAAEEGQLPGEWARERMVWAATSGPDEVDLGGPTDERLFDTDGNRFGMMPHGNRFASDGRNNPYGVQGSSHGMQGSSRQGDSRGDRASGQRDGSNGAEARWLIMQPGYASGDQFAVAAALVNDPNLHVLIAQGPPFGHRGHDPVLDKSAAIADFYRHTGIDPRRIHFVQAESPHKQQAWPALNKEGRRIVEQDWGVSRWHEHVQGITNATDYVATEFSPRLRSSLRNAWGLERHYDREIQTWLHGRGIQLPPTSGRVLVLWSRFSGKAYNWGTLRGRMEHDTSFQGVRQLLRVAARDYHAVIITGDPHPNHRQHSGKWTEVVQEMRTELGVNNIHHITGFWKETVPQLTAWGGGTRTGQFRLYDYFNRHHSLRHLGFRSGNLEAMALIGHRVRYLEEAQADAASRMVQWHDWGAGTTRKGGMAPGYERLIISEPVTASGRYSKKLQDEQGKTAFNPPPPGSRWPKPVEIYGLDRGFTYTDLEEIRAYLGARQPSHPDRDRNAFEWDRFEYFKRKYTPVSANLKWYAQHLLPDGTPYKNAVLQTLAWTDGFFALQPETYPGGALQMSDDLTHNVMPQLKNIWTYYRQLTDMYASSQQPTQSRPLGGPVSIGKTAGGTTVPVDAGRVSPQEYEWLERVNPYRDQAGEFATNCVLTAIAVDMSLADQEGAVYQAPPSESGALGRPEGEASGLRNHLAAYLDRDPDPVDGPTVVVEAMSRAPLGARGMVVIEDADAEIAHVINVTRDDNGVVFLDGQAGGLAPAPAGAVSFLPTTDGIPGFPLTRGHSAVDGDVSAGGSGAGSAGARELQGLPDPPDSERLRPQELALVPGRWDPVGKRFDLDPGLLSANDPVRIKQVSATQAMLESQYLAGQQGMHETVHHISIAATDPAQATEHILPAMIFVRSLADSLGSVALTLRNGQTITICAERRVG